MAYLDLINGRTEVAAPMARELARQYGLTQIERDAVMFARFDRRDSLKPSGRLYRIGVLCFGFPRRSNALASPKLEALRRFAVAVAHGSAASATTERQQLLSIGYSEYQVSIAASLAVGFRKESSKLLSTVLFVAALLGGAFLLIDRHVGDHLVSAIVAATVMVPIFASLAPRDPSSSSRQRSHS